MLSVRLEDVLDSPLMRAWLEGEGAANLPYGTPVIPPRGTCVDSSCALDMFDKKTYTV